MEEREILSSWKEISSYLGIGVRTAQRWESELGLPVHRPEKLNKTYVIGWTTGSSAKPARSPGKSSLPG